MSLPPSDLSPPLAADNSQEPRRGCLLATLSGVFDAAVVVGFLWGPAMVGVALLLRPPQLASNRYPNSEVAPILHDAELRMWIILIACFLVVLAIVTLAIVVERRALRFAGSGAMVARLRKGEASLWRSAF